MTNFSTILSESVWGGGLQKWPIGKIVGPKVQTLLVPQLDY